MLKVVFIGCVHFSQITLNHIFRLPNVCLIGVVTSMQTKAIGDYACLESDAKNLSVDHFNYENNDNDLTDWIRQRGPDVIYCFGWTKLLSKDIFDIPRLGTIGYHPTSLPKNRGRHPIIWSLVLGLTSTSSTFFFIDDGIDSGDILSQEEVSISPQDNAESLYEKLIQVALNQITDFTQQLFTGQYSRLAQDNDKATYWRKRDKEDGIIDWRMTATAISNLIRALSKPYSGATCIHNTCVYRILKSNVIEYPDKSTEPGKIMFASNGKFTVKCGEDALEIVTHDFSKIPKVGTYL